MMRILRLLRMDVDEEEMIRIKLKAYDPKLIR